MSADSARGSLLIAVSKKVIPKSRMTKPSAPGLTELMIIALHQSDTVDSKIELKVRLDIN